MTTTTADRTRKVIATQLGVVIATDDANLFDDLAADSLDTIELVMALEEEFGIKIPDDDAVDIRTVGDAIALVERRVG